MPRPDHVFRVLGEEEIPLRKVIVEGKETYIPIFAFAGASAEGTFPVSVGPASCLGQGQLNVTNSAVVRLSDIAGGIPSGAVSARIQAQNASVRINFMDSDPTPSVGFRLDDGAWDWVNTDLTKIRFIAVSTAVVLNVQFFNRPM